MFDNDDGMLFPNQFVNAQLLVDTNRDAVVVPSASVQRGPTYAYVYVVQPDEKEKGEKEKGEKAASMEYRYGNFSSGLAPGDIVVTDGIDKLKDDALVSTKEPKEPGSPGPAAVASTRTSEKHSDAAKHPAAQKDGESAPGPKGAQ